MKISERLWRGARRLEKFGWHQHTYRAEYSSARCIMGSIGYTDENWAATFYLNSTVNYLDNFIRYSVSSVGILSATDWNDVCGRTATEVILAMSMASIAAEDEGL